MNSLALGVILLFCGYGSDKSDKGCLVRTLECVAMNNAYLESSERRASKIVADCIHSRLVGAK